MNRLIHHESQVYESPFSQIIFEETKKKDKKIHATLDYPYNKFNNNQVKNRGNESDFNKKSIDRKDKLIIPLDLTTI